MAELRRPEPARLLDAAFRIYSERGAGEMMLERIAKKAKTSPERILYWYDDLETLFRLAVDAKIRALLAPLQSWRPSAGSTRDAIRGYAEECVRLLSSDDYRRLCYVVIRDGMLYPWLVKRHDAVLLATVQSALARLVREATDRSGIRFEIRASGARAFVARLQRELALPMLLPRQKEPTRLECRLLSDRAVDDAMGALYPAGMIIEGLARAARA